MSLSEIPMPADAIIPANCKDDPAARLDGPPVPVVTRPLARNPTDDLVCFRPGVGYSDRLHPEPRATPSPDPYGLGRCPHPVPCEPDSIGVSVGHTWCGAFAVGRDRSPGPEANATCSRGHTNRVDQWPGYRPMGAQVTAVQRPAPKTLPLKLSIESAADFASSGVPFAGVDPRESWALVKKGVRVVELTVEATDCGWRTGVRRGLVEYGSAQVSADAVFGCNICWDGDARREGVHAHQWYRRFVDMDGGGPPTAIGVGREEDAEHLEGVLRSAVRRAIHDRAASLERTLAVCDILVGPQVFPVTDHLADALARLEDWNPWPVGGAPLTPLTLPCEEAKALQNWWRLRKVEHAERARRCEEEARLWAGTPRPYPTESELAGRLPVSFTAPITAADLSLDKRRPMAERYGPSPMAAMLREHAPAPHPRHLLNPDPVWTDALAWAAEAIKWLRRVLFADEHAVVWARVQVAGMPTGPDAAWWVWTWDSRDGERPPKVGLRLNPDTGGILVRRACLAKDDAMTTVTLPTRGTWAEALQDVRAFLAERASGAGRSWASLGPPGEMP